MKKKPVSSSHAAPAPWGAGLSQDLNLVKRNAFELLELEALQWRVESQLILWYWCFFPSLLPFSHASSLAGELNWAAWPGPPLSPDAVNVFNCKQIGKINFKLKNALYLYFVTIMRTESYLLAILLIWSGRLTKLKLYAPWWDSDIWFFDRLDCQGIVWYLVVIWTLAGNTRW